MLVKSLCGVILASADPERLARFYEEILDLEFQREDHGNLLPHYGVDIGQVHFGIHPPANLGSSNAGNSSTSVAFNVLSLPDVMERLETSDAVEIIAPHDEGFGMVATYSDPEGNLFEIVELTYEFGA